MFSIPGFIISLPVLMPLKATIIAVPKTASCYCVFRIRELLSASLLEATPNVNTSDQDDHKPQNFTECND